MRAHNFIEGEPAIQCLGSVTFHVNHVYYTLYTLIPAGAVELTGSDISCGRLVNSSFNQKGCAPLRRRIAYGFRVVSSGRQPAPGELRCLPERRSTDSGLAFGYLHPRLPRKAIVHLRSSSPQNDLAGNYHLPICVEIWMIITHRSFQHFDLSRM